MKTTDNKCYNLYASRGSSNIYYSSESNYALLPEPCKTASNTLECTECDPTTDSGLVVISAAKGDAALLKRSFCIYNKEAGHRRGSSLYLNFNSVANADLIKFDIEGCKEYKLDTVPGSLCTKADTTNGWSLTGAEATTLQHSTLATASNLSKNCKPGKVTGADCTECEAG